MNFKLYCKRVWCAPPATEADGPESSFFFLIVTVVLGMVAAFEIWSVSSLQAVGRLIPYLVGMAVHILLYWFSPRFASSLRRSVAYLAVQAALVFGLTRFACDLSSVMGLYPALLGIAVGLLRERRRVVVGVAAWLALATINIILNLGLGGLSYWLLYAPPLTLFVVIYVALYSRQVAAREQAQGLLRELEAAHRELAVYANQVGDLTRAEERRRMARELHDTLAQGVAGLVLQLEAVDSHLDQSNIERARSIVHQAMASARATLAEARRAIDDLRAETTPDLADDLRRETGRFTEATGIPCALEMELIDGLSAPLGEALPRMVAEGLRNVARHARAGRAWVKLVIAAGALMLEIGDDGVGFDPARGLSIPGHYGLLGLRERARLAGGSLEIVSAPGQGTRLLIAIGPPTEGVGA
jgi:NarL family two-component system sensor histidine kinase YdfH